MMCGNGGTEADMGHASPKYTAEFKQRTVQLYRERGGTYAEIGRELGVDPGSVSDWVKRIDAAGPPRPCATSWSARASCCTWT